MNEWVVEQKRICDSTSLSQIGTESRAGFTCILPHANWKAGDEPYYPMTPVNFEEAFERCARRARETLACGEVEWWTWQIRNVNTGEIVPVQCLL